MLSPNNFRNTCHCPFAYRNSGKYYGFANEIKPVQLYAVFCIDAHTGIAVSQRNLPFFDRFRYE